MNREHDARPGGRLRYVPPHQRWCGPWGWEAARQGYLWAIGAGTTTDLLTESVVAGTSAGAREAATTERMMSRSIDAPQDEEIRVHRQVAEGLHGSGPRGRRVSR